MSGISDFITRWKTSGGSEQGNAQLFLAELCDVLDLLRPEPARPVNEENTYSFERKIYVWLTPSRYESCQAKLTSSLWDVIFLRVLVS